MKNNEDKFVYSELKPSWLYTIVPSEYENDNLLKIIMFFVIYSPCPNQSKRSKTLTEYGWDENVWKNRRLKDKLDKEIFGNDPKHIKVVNGKENLKDEFIKMQLYNEDFFENRSLQRMCYCKISKKGCNNQYMSLFYHIRNALAHGRIAMFPHKEDIMFVMEGGEDCSEQFIVNSRIIILQSSLLKIIQILQNPINIKEDFKNQIIDLIKDGYNQKKEIIEQLDITESSYNRYMDELKIEEKIVSRGKRWFIL